ncbi:MAG: 30S ribosomal protein S5 [Patescibacteria group bacterium]|nr:30S ribosomal protein S5 [Patescibacteria group bacterium]
MVELKRWLKLQENTVYCCRFFVKMIMRRNEKIIKKSEFKEKVLEIRRVARVMAGGKRFSFRAAVVVGDERGRVGFGTAKGLDVAAAVQKAKHQAEKNVIKVQLKDARTILHDTEAKFGAAVVRIKLCKPGHGVIAGGASRVILELAGIKDVSAKTIGRTKNKIVNAMATIKALQSFIGVEMVVNNKKIL